MVEPAQAARVILDGVTRNRALIAFPGYVRWAPSTCVPFVESAQVRLVTPASKVLVPEASG